MRHASLFCFSVLYAVATHVYEIWRVFETRVGTNSGIGVKLLVMPWTGETQCHYIFRAPALRGNQASAVRIKVQLFVTADVKGEEQFDVRCELGGSFYRHRLPGMTTCQFDIHMTGVLRSAQRPSQL